MNTISQHVGQRIKKYRKSRGLTIEQFAQKISKSKATLSKYENASITIDIETLLEIADNLEIDLANLIDYKSTKVKPDALPKNFYFNRHTYYMYYYDGRTKKVIRSIFYLSPSKDEENPIFIRMCHGLETFDNPDKCQHLFTGSMKPYDTITHMYLTNEINTTEKMYTCIMNPLHASSHAVGIISGIGSNPFFAPISIKTLISKDILEENDAFMNVIRLSKEDYHLFKYYNMMVINRPSSLFLEEKNN